VDPVRIDRIDNFGTPFDVGSRIVKIESQKEGVTAVELLSSEERGGSYFFDYTVESTRGNNRYLSKAVVQAKRLYVFTVQLKRADYDRFKEDIGRCIESFRVISTKA
jgi:hypothetical protein